jgi:hypothetical protein
VRSCGAVTLILKNRTSESALAKRKVELRVLRVSPDAIVNQRRRSVLRGQASIRWDCYGAIGASLSQSECIQRIPGTDHKILPAIKHVSLRPIADVRTQARMPQNFSVGGIECNKMLRAIA